MKAKIFVIAGAPCTGKTTLIESLKDKGLNVLEEGVADIDDSVRGKEFDLVLFEQRLKSIDKISENEAIYFSDRGLGDTLAYLKMKCVAPSDSIMKKAKEIRYSGVFLLEPLGFYENNELRIEKEENQLELQEALVEAYRFLGYEIIFVPNMDVEDRADFVLGKISKE